MTELIGIFGGTFDPVHNGHIKSIELLNQQCDFANIHWLLSARPPHKDQVSAPIENRFAMLQMALRGQASYVLDDREILRPEKSYTFDTVQDFKKQYPDALLCLIIGADSMHNLASWHRYSELLDLVHIIVLNRPGYSLEVPQNLQNRLCPSLDDLSLEQSGQLAIFEASEFDISSTKLRIALSKTRPTASERVLIEDYLPAKLIDYIYQHQLYKSQSMNSEQIKNQVVDALEEVKGQDISVINITEISDFADYMVVVSGTSDTHVKALARTASDNLRKQGVKPLNEDGAEVGEWVLVDFGDVVLHVMRPQVREYYDLEKLWDEDVRNMVKQHRENQQDV